MNEVKDKDQLNHLSQALVDEVLAYVKEYYKNNVPNEYGYHDIEHTLRVWESAKELAAEANLSSKENICLQLAALFHDIGYKDGPDDHEERGKIIAREFLDAKSIPKEDIMPILHCIGNTKMGASCPEKLCQLIKDADLSGLASAKYFEKADKLRKEMNLQSTCNISKKQWVEDNISFFKNHEYQTAAGKNLYKEGKLSNLKKLKKMSEESKTKKKKLLTIGSSKNAQTQFKTALRNHIDLSSIADNKANIMISVNALIITVALPILADKLLENTNYLIPTILLAATTISSMIYATLATRPIKMNGATSTEKILAKESNLFFFGNYYKMSFSEYEKGLEKVVSDNEILDNSIMRDLFFLGKALGNKYDRLRICYNIFMYGIMLSVFSFIVVNLI